ncbi:hypothetical protein RJ639_014287 [Escallonia herrerae]|uniref:AIPP2-like SPOC-like domain-containing protein n=1 Tax=Escallonia herrerae TaxID=1293975 RepID=A0AA88VLX6_9ASTE|nr:hypothetical protein RJ639_014287 [Escallonia herrerae]
MESISRPLHRRQASSGNGLFGKNAYDGVFAGPPAASKLGAPKVSSRVEDYGDIFGSRRSSIPTLDVSAALDGASASPGFRSSKLDYAAIFGSSRDSDVGVSHEELFAGPKRSKKSSSKSRTAFVTESPSNGSDCLNPSEKNQAFSSEAPLLESSDVVKQFNMSYHKTSQRSKDGTNGTTYVAQLHDVPGFTCFIDETAPSRNTEGLKAKSSNRDVHRKVDFSKEKLEEETCREDVPHLANKQTSGGAKKSRNGSSRDGSFSNDKLFDAYEVNLKSHPSKVPPTLPATPKDNKCHPKSAVASNFEVPKNDASESAAGDCSPTFFDEELDVNSAAAASVAALKDAIEKAQESIRIAKESMERNKNGLRSCLNRNPKDSLKVKHRKETIVAHARKMTKEKNASETCENLDAVLQVDPEMERKDASRREVISDVRDSEKLFIATKVVGQTQAENLEAAEECESQTSVFEVVNNGKHRTNLTASEQLDSRDKNLQSVGEYGSKIKEMRTTKETLVQQEGAFEAVKEAYELEGVERKLETVTAHVYKSFSVCCVHEHAENAETGISQEDDDPFKHEDSEKKLKESLETVEAERKTEPPELKEDDYEKILNEPQELAGTETKKQEVPEREYVNERVKDDEKKENEIRLCEVVDEVTDHKQEEAFQRIDIKNNLTEACDYESHEKKRMAETFGYEGKEKKRLDEVHELNIAENIPTEQEYIDDIINDVGDHKTGKRQEEAFQWVENENNLKELCGSESNGKKHDCIRKGEECEKRKDKVQELEIDEDRFTQLEHVEEGIDDVEVEENENRRRMIHDAEVSEKRQEDAFRCVENETNLKGACGSECYEKRHEEAGDEEDTEKIFSVVHELESDENRPTDPHDGRESQEKRKHELELEGNEKKVVGAVRFEETENIEGKSEEKEKIEVLQNAAHEKNSSGAGDGSDGFVEIKEACHHEINIEITQGVNYENGGKQGVDKAFYDYEDDEAEAVEVAYKLNKKEMFETGGSVQGSAEDIETGQEVNHTDKALSADCIAAKVGSTDMDFEHEQLGQNVQNSEVASHVKDGVEILANKTEETVKEDKTAFDNKEEEHGCRHNEEASEKDELLSEEEENENMSLENEETVEEDKIALEEEEEKNKGQETTHGERQWVEDAKEMDISQVTNVSEEKESTVETDEEIKRSQGRKENGENLTNKFSMDEKRTDETLRREVEEKEHLRKIGEVNKREREREREKDRMAVERAIREARERAFAEARERAERAAVERATAEVRQRVMVEAREKLEKASAGTKSSAERSNIEAKLRAERAAVERATAEARERALEKAMSRKTTSEARAHLERSVAEKFLSASRDDATRQSSSSVSISTDLHGSDETNTESAQRNKARLERHQRIMDRAAKALAEKNMRDLLAQKEQAEKNRLSEALDVDIKRWSSGKEGNLRALLSTLHYILGPGSGWQPISLTDIVTTNAVKKAYRKATLSVHPDKLQQRGASIQQKYICEKVFDLLKPTIIKCLEQLCWNDLNVFWCPQAAWNKFDSEERQRHSGKGRGVQPSLFEKRMRFNISDTREHIYQFCSSFMVMTTEALALGSAPVMSLGALPPENAQPSDGLLAHLSTKACRKVCEAACSLPTPLHLEMLPKSDMWPVFQVSDPSYAPRPERFFDYYVDGMISEEVAMRIALPNAKLSIFTFGATTFIWKELILTGSGPKKYGGNYKVLTHAIIFLALQKSTSVQKLSSYSGGGG